jgi:DNA-binding NtrC family response regulator
MKPKVLVVDDEILIRKSIERILEKEGYVAVFAINGKDAIDLVSKEEPEIIFLDLRLPDVDGLTVLKRIKEIDQDVIVFIFSAFGTFKDVVDAIKLGAFDYIQKPYSNEVIKLGLIKACEAIKLKREIKGLRYKDNLFSEKNNIIAKSIGIQNVLDLARNVAKSTDTPVLIQGETGVGKEIVALTIHNSSPRRHAPFLSINCGAIPQDLMESELFGHEKGAFTGASNSKPGIFELAEGGTLLLDEIGELDSQGQVKLLRVLGNRTFFRVGGRVQKICNVRILASTNKDLEEAIRRGDFREDLYYRLNVIKIVVPPLRERKDDIIPLSEFFIKEFNKKFNKKIGDISPRVKELLFNYEWRGNVRELKNLIERAVLLADNDLIDEYILNFGEQHFCSDNSITINLTTNGKNIDDINKMIIERTLKTCNGNQMKAAQILRLPRSTFRYRMKKYKVSSI